MSILLDLVKAYLHSNFGKESEADAHVYRNIHAMLPELQEVPDTRQKYFCLSSKYFAEIIRHLNQSDVMKSLNSSI